MMLHKRCINIWPQFRLIWRRRGDQLHSGRQTWDFKTADYGWDIKRGKYFTEKSKAMDKYSSHVWKSINCSKLVELSFSICPLTEKKKPGGWRTAIHIHIFSTCPTWFPPPTERSLRKSASKPSPVWIFISLICIAHRWQKQMLVTASVNFQKCAFMTKQIKL